ncbi:MAG: hypothetical protein HYS27_02710 [Deltaproteobacteria bacterium]|nr:hypothetical protein [Deltaproteobacteria bacterium]
MHLRSLIALAVVTPFAVAAPSRAQAEAPQVDVEDLFEPPAPEEPAAEPAPAPSPPAEAAPPTPEASEPTPAPVAPPAPVATQLAAPPAHGTIAERGGLFGLGLAVAPKLGGGLGNVTLAGLGGTFAAQLELGWGLPMKLPLGRDLQATTVIGYSGPSSSATVDGDPRLPDGSFSYTLTVHQLDVVWGGLYRIPLDAVPWLRPYVLAGMRTVWSWTVIGGEAGGEPFGSYVESAFDLGAALTLGADFYFGPGALLLELQTTVGYADRFVLRDASVLGFEGAVGYRFFL